MEKDYIVASVSPEAMLPMFPEPARGANYRGGLGIRTGDDVVGLAKRGIKAKVIVPLYEFHWVTRERINYDQTPAERLFEIRPEINGARKVINVRKIDFEGVEIFGLCSPDFNLLYTADRWERLQQEVLLGHAVPALLKKLGVQPDIVWLQEGYAALVIPVMKADPYFAETKFLFTTHTPVPEGMEKFRGEEEWIKALGDLGRYRNDFLKDGLIDMTWGAMINADMITAVSKEHGEITRGMFPGFSHKIVGIRNGSSRDLWLSPQIKAIEGNINPLKLWEAQQVDKEEFLNLVERKRGLRLDSEKLLFGFVRRFAWYKRLLPMLGPILPALCAPRGEIVDTSLGRLEGLGIQVFAAGRAHESDTRCLGWMAEFEKYTDIFKDRFVFLPEYHFELLRASAWGCDLWFSCPEPGKEACGTSDQRAAINGKINITTCGGGPKEYIKEINPATGEGNGFFIEPYEPMTIYRKLKTASDLYYGWVEKGDECWPRVCFNAFETGRILDIVLMIEKYEKIFEKLLKTKAVS